MYLNIRVVPRSKLNFVSIINKTGIARVNMTLRRVRVNIVAMGKQ